MLRARIVTIVSTVALSLTLLIVGASSAAAYSKQVGDNHLEVIATVPDCNDDNLGEQCGLELYVRTNFVQDNSDDAPLVDATCSLTSTTGTSIKLSSYGYSGCSETDGGANFQDDNYWGNAVLAETPTATGLPNGTYIFKYHVSQGGYWSCSIYDPNGCSWMSGSSGSGTYYFTWTGATNRDIPPASAPHAPARTWLSARAKHRIVFRWTPPPTTANTPPVTGYKLTITASLGTITRTTTNPKAHWCSVRNLPAGHQVRWKVQAKNMIGWGSASTGVTTTKK